MYCGHIMLAHARLDSLATVDPARPSATIRTRELSEEAGPASDIGARMSRNIAAPMCGVSHVEATRPGNGWHIPTPAMADL